MSVPISHPTSSAASEFAIPHLPHGVTQSPDTTLNAGPVIPKKKSKSLKCKYCGNESLIVKSALTHSYKCTTRTEGSETVRREPQRNTNKKKQQRKGKQIRAPSVDPIDNPMAWDRYKIYDPHDGTEQLFRGVSVDSRMNCGKMEYLIQWERTWIDEAYLDPKVVHEFQTTGTIKNGGTVDGRKWGSA